MVISTFIDYYDDLISKDVALNRIPSDKFEEYNSYRYSLIVGRNVFDFIIRDGSIISGEELRKFGEVVKGDIVKIKGYEADYFTTFTTRTNSYFDASNMCEKKDCSLLILQNFDTNNNSLNPIKIPKYGLDSKIWVNPNLKSMGFINSIQPETIASILNNI